MEKYITGDNSLLLQDHCSFSESSRAHEHNLYTMPDVHHPSFQLFQIQLTREYCAPDKTRFKRPDGKHYDTVKPLGSHGFDLSRTLLLDDSARKILPHEKMNGLIVPPFLACSDPEYLQESEDRIEFFGTLLIPSSKPVSSLSVYMTF